VPISILALFLGIQLSLQCISFFAHFLGLKLALHADAKPHLAAHDMLGPLLVWAAPRDFYCSA
jgi:hypothetical protein